jgi:hypothetical protein
MGCLMTRISISVFADLLAGNQLQRLWTVVVLLAVAADSLPQPIDPRFYQGPFDVGSLRFKVVPGQTEPIPHSACFNSVQGAFDHTMNQSRREVPDVASGKRSLPSSMTDVKVQSLSLF